MSDEPTRKLLDGIGATIEGSLERVLAESSSELDNGHSIDDTAKLIECGVKCWREEMNHSFLFYCI